jgi:hypothetical protein
MYSHHQFQTEDKNLFQSIANIIVFFHSNIGHSFLFQFITMLYHIRPVNVSHKPTERQTG